MILELVKLTIEMEPYFGPTNHVSNHFEGTLNVVIKNIRQTHMKGNLSDNLSNNLR